MEVDIRAKSNGGAGGKISIQKSKNFKQKIQTEKGRMGGGGEGVGSSSLMRNYDVDLFIFCFLVKMPGNLVT
jgi:hypothetical protein